MIENKPKIGWLVFGKREIKYYISVCVLIVLLMWAWGYVSLLNSDDYAFAKKYVESNRAVNEALGTVKSSRPGFSNFKRSYSSGNWTAKFQVVVTGEKKSGTVSLGLRSSENGWLVDEGTLALDGDTPIDIKGAGSGN